MHRGDRSDRRRVTAPGRALAILDAQGRDARRAVERPRSRAPLPARRPRPSVLTRADRRRRVARARDDRRPFGDRTLVLVVASPMSDVLREQREAQEAMLVGIPIVLLLAAGGGLWLASVGLRPITDMARRAARIPPNGLEDLGETAADRRARSAGDRVQRPGRAAARGAADAAAVHGRRVARAAHAGVDRPRDVRRHAEPRASRRGRVPRGDRDRRRSVAAARAGWSRTCWCWRAPTPAAIRCGRSICISTRSSPTAGAPSTCSRPSAASPSDRRGSPDIPFRGDEDLLRRLVLNVLQNAVQHTPSGGSVAVEIRQDAGGGADPRHRRRRRHPAADQRADLRSLRAARRRAAGPGHRARPADRALDRRSAPRHARPRAEQRRPARRSACRCRFDSSAGYESRLTRLRQPVDEDFRDAVDEAEQRRVAGRLPRRRPRAAASASRPGGAVDGASSSRRGHARGDVAAVDQRADRFGDRRRRRHQARDLDERRGERAARVAGDAGAGDRRRARTRRPSAARSRARLASRRAGPAPRASRAA